MGQELRVFFVFGFMIITIITSVIVLLANVGAFGSTVTGSDFARWGMGTVLTAIVVATVAAFKWEVLSSKNMLIVFDFKRELSIGARLDRCIYEIVDEKNKRIGKGEVKIARDNVSGYWRCFIPLPSRMRYEHITMLKIRDSKGKEYQVSDWILQHTLEI
jgi:hypothetical protein